MSRQLQQLTAALANQGAMVGRCEEALQQILTKLQPITLALQAGPAVTPHAAPAVAPPTPVPQPAQ